MESRQNMRVLDSQWSKDDLTSDLDIRHKVYKEVVALFRDGLLIYTLHLL